MKISDCPICDAYIRLIEEFGSDFKANNSLKTEYKLHREKYHGEKND